MFGHEGDGIEEIPSLSLTKYSRCRRAAKYGIGGQIDQRQFRTCFMGPSRSDGAPLDCADIFDNRLINLDVRCIHRYSPSRSDETQIRSLERCAQCEEMSRDCIGKWDLQGDSG
jgi:hypothetical protein